MSTTISPFVYAALALFSFAAVIDLRHRRITNEIVLAVVALAVIRMILEFDALAAFHDIGAAGAVLVVLAVLWYFRWLGGGDVKLIFAGALLVGTKGLADYLVLTAFCGGVLALLVFVDVWLHDNFGWTIGVAFPSVPLAAKDMPFEDERLRQGMALAAFTKPSVPYGIAIAIGCVATLLLTQPTPVTW